jgi:hypothetical protein
MKHFRNFKHSVTEGPDGTIIAYRFTTGIEKGQTLYIVADQDNNWKQAGFAGFPLQSLPVDSDGFPTLREIAAVAKFVAPETLKSLL